MSWSYNPMLGVEVSEVGATLIALSVPGVKPLFDRFILRKDSVTGSGSSKYARTGENTHSRGTALRTLSKHPHHGVLGSQDTAEQYGSKQTTKDDCSEDSAEGILVKVDIQVSKEDAARGGGSRNPFDQV